MKKSSFADSLYHDMMKNYETKTDGYLVEKDIKEAVDLISEAALIFDECGMTKEAKVLTEILSKFKG